MSNGDDWERYARLGATIGKLLLDGKRRLEDFVAIQQDFVFNPRWSPASVATPTTEQPTEPAEKFVQIADLGIMEVPASYVHHTQLGRFRREYWEKLRVCDDRVTDQYYGRASVRLVAGRRLQVTVVEATTRFTSDEALAYLYAKKCVLVGAQGLTLAYELLRDSLPRGLSLLLSFDEEDALWHDSQGAEVPYMAVSMGELRIGGFKTNWGSGHRLICFSDPTIN